MISIREQVFETNSSSCHCIVFCNTDFMKKLLNKEILYTGTFEYDDDYGTYENHINPNTYIDRDGVIAILMQFCKDTVETNHHLSWDWMMEYQHVLKGINFTSMSLEELLNCPQFDLFDILESCGVHALRTWLMFGELTEDEKSDTSVLSTQEFTDSDGKPVTILHTVVNC